jgi:hypothetical protein
MDRRGDTSAAGVLVRNSNQTRIERMIVSDVSADDAAAFRLGSTDGFMLDMSEVFNVDGWVMDVGNSTNMSGNDNEA